MAITDFYLATLKDGSTRLDAGPAHAGIDRSTIADVQIFSVDVPLEIVVVRDVDPHGHGRIVVDGATPSDRVVMLDPRREDEGGTDYGFRAFDAVNVDRVVLPVTDGLGAAAVVHGRKQDEHLPELDEWDSSGEGFWYRKIEPRTLEQHFERFHENDHLMSIVREGGRYVLDGTGEFETLEAAKREGDRRLREKGPEFGSNSDEIVTEFGLDPDNWRAEVGLDGDIHLTSLLADEKWMIVTSMDDVEIGELDDSRPVKGPARTTVSRYADGTLAYDTVAPAFRP